MGQIRFKDYLKDYLEYYHITNKDFANRISITPKHLISILNGDSDLSSQVIDNISLVTNIPSDYIYKIEANYKFECTILEYLNTKHLTKTQYLNKFHYKYLLENNFLTFTDKEDKLEIIKDILKFLRVTGPEKVYEIDSISTTYYKSKNDKVELLLLWLEKCYRQTWEQTINIYQKENISVLVQYILDCARKFEFDPQKLVQKFNEYGIYLVIQEDIPGSKIRGAFKVHREVPSIYLTYKHRRIADIYFALLHELAHCKSDFNKAKGSSLVSFDVDTSLESEENADRQAYQWMVDDCYYYNVCCKKDYDIEKENKYPKSFIIYRLAKDHYIRYDSKIYQQYNILL